MRRTRILSFILALLMLALAFIIFVKNYKENFETFDDIINLFQSKKVNIPDTKENNLNYEFKTVSITDNFEPQNINDIKSIYYTILNNGWNEFTFYCPEEYTSCISDVTNYANNNEEMSLLNNYVSPYNSFKKLNTLIDNDEIYITVEKLYSENEIEYTKTKINSIIDELNINTSSPSIIDIKLIHNYLIKNTSYDENYNKEDTDTISNKAYGLFTNHIALCSGYSDTLALFLNELNIPNFKVTSIDHVWNVIYINNKWSHIDVTWDDDEVNENNSYNFFVISTDELLKLDKTKHTFDISLYKELQ